LLSRCAVDRLENAVAESYPDVEILEGVHHHRGADVLRPERIMQLPAPSAAAPEMWIRSW
jgi:hypothetical protein